MVWVCVSIVVGFFFLFVVGPILFLGLLNALIFGKMASSIPEKQAPDNGVMRKTGQAQRSPSAAA